MAKTKNTKNKAVKAAKTPVVPAEPEPAIETPETAPVVQPAPEVEPEAAEPEYVAPDETSAPDVIVDKAPETVTVGLCRPVGVTFKVNDKNGIEHVIEIKGTGAPLAGLEKGIIPGGGFMLTPGIDAELWAAVVQKYGSMAMFRNGLIFYTGSAKDAKHEARNRKDLRSGMEPVDPEKTLTKEF